MGSENSFGPYWFYLDIIYKNDTMKLPRMYNYGYFEQFFLENEKEKCYYKHTIL